MKKTVLSFVMAAMSAASFAQSWDVLYESPKECYDYTTYVASDIKGVDFEEGVSFTGKAIGVSSAIKAFRKRENAKVGWYAKFKMSAYQTSYKRYKVNTYVPSTSVGFYFPVIIPENERLSFNFGFGAQATTVTNGYATATGFGPEITAGLMYKVSKRVHLGVSPSFYATFATGSGNVFETNVPLSMRIRF
jgi:hypothetical protein